MLRPFVACLAIMLLSVMLPAERTSSALNQDHLAWEQTFLPHSDLALIHDSGFGKTSPPSRELAQDTLGMISKKSALKSTGGLCHSIRPRSHSLALPKAPWIGTIVLRI